MTNMMDRTPQDSPGGEDRPNETRAAEPISTSSEWTFDLIQQYDDEIAKCAAEFGLDTYPNQVEVISAEQMMDAYSSVGMPVGYHHWSFGKQFLSTSKGYQRGQKKRRGT